MNKSIRQVWTFSSDSSPGVEYQTLLYADGSTSCACKGWTRRVSLADGSRSCKHVRFVDLGVADQFAAATHRYETTKPKTQNRYAQTNKPLFALGKRKLIL